MIQDPYDKQIKELIQSKAYIHITNLAGSRIKQFNAEGKQFVLFFYLVRDTDLPQLDEEVHKTPHSHLYPREFSFKIR